MHRSTTHQNHGTGLGVVIALGLAVVGFLMQLDVVTMINTGAQRLLASAFVVTAILLLALRSKTKT